MARPPAPVPQLAYAQGVKGPIVVLPVKLAPRISQAQIRSAAAQQLAVVAARFRPTAPPSSAVSQQFVPQIVARELARLPLAYDAPTIVVTKSKPVAEQKGKSWTKTKAQDRAMQAAVEEEMRRQEPDYATKLLPCGITQTMLHMFEESRAGVITIPRILIRLPHLTHARLGEVIDILKDIDLVEERPGTYPRELKWTGWDLKPKPLTAQLKYDVDSLTDHEDELDKHIRWLRRTLHHTCTDGDGHLHLSQDDLRRGFGPAEQLIVVRAPTGSLLDVPFFDEKMEKSVRVRSTCGAIEAYAIDYDPEANVKQEPEDICTDESSESGFNGKRAAPSEHPGPSKIPRLIQSGPSSSASGQVSTPVRLGPHRRRCYPYRLAKNEGLVDLFSDLL